MPILLDPWTLKQAALDLDTIVQAGRLDELNDCLQYARSQQRGRGQTVNEELHVFHIGQELAKILNADRDGCAAAAVACLAPSWQATVLAILKDLADEIRRPLVAPPATTRTLPRRRERVA
jgi:hypothetical protein